VWIAQGITAWREMDPQKLQRFAAEMAKMAGCGAGRAGAFGADPSWKLAKAESRAIPAAEFQPLAGFARQTLQEMMGGH